MSEALLLYSVLHHLEEMHKLKRSKYSPNQRQSAPISGLKTKGMAPTLKRCTYSVLVSASGLKSLGTLKSVTFPEEPSIASSARPITSESLIASAWEQSYSPKSAIE